MQSRPTEVSKQQSSVATHQETSPSRQHGVIQDRAVSDLPSRGAGSESGSARSTSPIAAERASDSGPDPPSSGLSHVVTPRNRSPVDRIIEHERSPVSFSRSKSRGPDFQVIPGPKGSAGTKVQLTDFPNEVLTHIFSHLPPATLSTVSLVSVRFHALITTPHAWRLAFARYFPGGAPRNVKISVRDGEDEFSEKRFFTRLTPLASWRSEYILRTRMLRALNRGKPAEMLNASVRSPNQVNAQVNYNSSLESTINQLDATFGTSLNKRAPKFIHGASDTGMATMSDPLVARVDGWGLADPLMMFEFAERHPGEPEYGLGSGQIVGVPNSMNVSRKYGMVCAEGSPGCLAYFRTNEEQRGRALPGSRAQSSPDEGIPWLDVAHETVCALWISKTINIPELTEGLVGILTGSSYGVVTAYSIGTNGLNARRLDRGEMTARWVLSPGVPIIAIMADEQYSLKRHLQGRIWAAALDALGEVFYLTDIPRRRVLEPGKISEDKLYDFAWETGRSVYWSLVEPTRRVARVDPFERSSYDGSYTPRGSCTSMGLSTEQVYAETKEIEKFVREKPKHFRNVCEGWDMQRRMEVDFAGCNENKAGESVFVFECALVEGQTPRVRRYTRFKQKGSISTEQSVTHSPTIQPSGTDTPSLFGGEARESLMLEPRWSFSEAKAIRRDSTVSATPSFPLEQFETWRVSTYSFGMLRAPQITTTSIDLSTYALLTIPEDPLLNLSASSEASSPMASPLGKMPPPGNPSEIPGQRSRLIAAGTKMGSVFVWNMRAPVSPSSEIVNTVEPLRVIHTDSPQISCLAISALYLVHGGNDGLVQAWDPLASNMQPIRTINSRFSSRARRRIAQAQATPWGVGINLFAAGAIYLDPDPSTLRGLVSIGTHLRYWSYSSQAADQYRSNKRRIRRSERGSNHGPDRVTQTGRGVLQDYIANERLELEREKKDRRKEQARMAGRFGVDLLGPGATEDEIMAYATMLSEEAAKEDEARRMSSSASSETVTDVMSSPVAGIVPADDDDDPDLAAAIRASLQDSDAASSPPPAPSHSADFAVRYVKDRSSPSRSPSTVAGSSKQTDADDLDFALQLSLAEERSRLEAEEEFPALGRRQTPSPTGKGKEKRRSS